jgi:hypothetical protein
MKYRVNGGVMGSIITTNTSVASGLFSIQEAANKIGDSAWPTIPKDTYFNYNTILLKGDGTNTSNNSTLVDSSTNAYTVTKTGNPVPGTFSPFSLNGWSNYFSGSDYIQTASSSSAFSFGTGDWTVEMWVNSVQFGNRGLLQTSTTAGGFAAASPPTGTGGIQVYLTVGGTIGVMVNGTWYNTGTTTMALNNWYHVAVVRNSGSVKLYINGTADSGFGTVADTSNYTATYAVYGGYFNGSYLCNSYISNLRILKGTALYTANFTPSTSALTAISNTSFLVAQSNRFIDKSSNNLSLTRTGATIVASTPFVPTTSYVASTNGGSIFFDGSADQISVSGSTNFSMGTGDFTIDFWCYALTVTDGRCLFNLYSASYHILFRFIGTSWQFYPGNATVSTDTPLNKWQHVAIVRYNGDITIYLDGVAAYTATDAGNYADTTLVLGNYANFRWHGFISNFRIVKGTSLYNANFTPPTAPTTAVSGTQVLLNGTNANIFDNTNRNNIVTNGSYISTSQSKFGGSSIYIPGGTASLYTVPISSGATPLANHAGTLGAGNWTIEMWLYCTIATFNNFFCFATSRYGSASYTGTWFFGIYTGTKKLVFYDAAVNLGQTSMDLPTNQWSHVAAVRYNNVIKLYVDGVLGLTTANNSTNYTVSELSVGFDRGEGAYPFTGYIDDFRITKGIARYTSAFTPPTVTHPEQ